MKFEDCIIIQPNDLQKFLIYKGQIIPDKAIKDGKVYNIKHKNDFLYLAGFVVILINNIIDSIFLLGSHPNQDEQWFYCLPSSKKYKKFTREYFYLLINNLHTYYLDDCYFDPADNLTYHEVSHNIKIQVT